METEKRKRGRPRKKDDTIPFWRFARAGMLTWAYDEARTEGEKHSVAVAQAVASVKQLYPTMRSSEAEMRRVLSRLRPRGAETILRFERSILSEEDLERKRLMREQVATLQGKEGLVRPAPPNDDKTRSVAVFKIRFAERPTYPRHNRKKPKEL